MGEEFPREAAFDSRGNPLFMSDGNLASAADAAQFPNMKLYAGGDRLHSGPVYDGWGHQARGGGESVSVPVKPSGDFVDGAIDQVVGGAIGCAIIGFFLLVSGPLDRWLMKLAKRQTSHVHELEKEVVSASGLNFGGFLAMPHFTWIWLLLFLRLPFALISFVLLYFCFFIPFCGPFLLLIMWGLVLIRGNERAWYSGRWATVDGFMRAKKRWAYALVSLQALLLLVGFFQYAPPSLTTDIQRAWSALGGVQATLSAPRPVKTSRAASTAVPTRRAASTAVPAPGSRGVDEVLAFNPGPGAEARYLTPEALLGEPDMVGWPHYEGIVQLGRGGSVVVAFVDNVVVDGNGPDLEIVGESVNDDFLRVEVSEDGASWHAFPKVGESSGGLDLADLGLERAVAVRITDVQPGTPTGAEVDAVVALNSGPP